jgi:hypothetical protein
MSLDHVQAREERSQPQRHGKTTLITGALIASIGLAITLLTFASAKSSGGVVIVAYGSIIGGIYQIFRGAQMMK